VLDVNPSGALSYTTRPMAALIAPSI
jgi:hypothetical protein